ncbi:MAG: UvrD-helicase domain-containing protein [Bacteroidales bacterium]|nr:UvrD-helicase domain-containing protein [Bacteroidales bacterium]
MIEIVKASAGAGKTYALTQDYIEFLRQGLSNDAYRHILAVTFTNKATDEMKRRILGRLFEYSLQTDKQGAWAKRMLISILHDYSNFSVTTIDRFFQQVMRSFAREMGTYSSYRVELDEAAVLNEAIDKMLDSLEDEENGELLSWMVKYALDHIKDGGSFKIQDELFSMSQLFLKEDFRIFRKENEKGYVVDREVLTKVKAEARSVIESFENSLRDLSSKALKILSDNGLSLADMKGGESRTQFNRFKSWVKGNFKDPSKTFFDYVQGPESWVAKSAWKTLGAKVQSADSDGLGEIIRAIAAMYGDMEQEGEYVLFNGGMFIKYRTAKLVLKTINLSGIFSDIYKVLSACMKERNIILLSETNELINSIIDGSDTPFIYERMGTRYDNLMLDEFQDTSLLQWKNFKPLFENSAAQNFGNMIVGDVKQSIYRWRGSDWKTLQSGVGQSFDKSILKSRLLDVNYRSRENIVAFNNMLFPAMLDILAEEELKMLYSDVNQKINKPDATGYVQVSFVNKDQAPKYDYMKEGLEALIAKGYPLNKITVLVRKNSEATDVARWLISQGYSVITEESMLISASLSVSRIVAILRFHSMPENPLAQHIMRQAGIDMQTETSKESLYEICEELIRKYKNSLSEGDVPYMNAFMDCVVEYCTNNGNNIAGFVQWWDETGSVSRYIAAPDGENAIRVMTIHKSKGLSLDAVILPGFQENLFHNSQPATYLWCDAGSVFPSLGIMPVKYKKDLLNTAFKESYRLETFNTKVDALNTAYVAFTRAKSAMLIYPVLSDEKNVSTVAGLMYNALKSKGMENDVYTLGEIGEYQDDGQSQDMRPMPIPSFLSVPMEGEDYLCGNGSPRLKLVLSSGDFFDGEKESIRLRGIAIHDILSRVNTAEDISDAVADAVNDGVISSLEAKEMQGKIERIVTDNECREWFSPECEVLNEVSIVDENGVIHRPDRVVLKDGAASVIDYKTGDEHSKYVWQVRRYLNLLRSMGYEAKGYLCYIKDGISVVQVS